MINTESKALEKETYVIYGAGIVGEALYWACKEAEIKVDCYCDNDSNKTTRLLNGLEVVHTPTLKTKYADAVFLISSADIQDVVPQLESMGYSKWHSCGEILKNFELAHYQFKLPQDFVEYAVSTAIQCQDSYLNPNKLFLKSVDIIVTERCSLRCRDCSNLMRYYKNPQDCDAQELAHDIDKFCGVVDEVNEFRVLGGEPFMNKSVHLIVKRLIEEKKVRKVVIYTNGTIVPNDEQIRYFENEKVLFILTDYGHLSRGIVSLTQKLSSRNISFYVQKAGGWTDCAKIVKHHRTPEKQSETFKNCCAKNTFTLSNGNLFRCPFSANAARLRAVPDFENDYIGIENSKDSPDKLKRKIRDFILSKDYLETCDHCNGRSFGDPIIQPAIQQKAPIDYVVYQKEK